MCREAVRVRRFNFDSRRISRNLSFSFGESTDDISADDTPPAARSRRRLRRRLRRLECSPDLKSGDGGDTAIVKLDKM